MTMLEKLAAFAEALPPHRRAAFEEALDELMDAYSPEYDFTEAEMAELERRMADPNPEYADPAEVEAIFRRYRKG